MTTIDSDTTGRYQRSLAEQQRTARELYEAEIALHDAHQTQVDTWIHAASEHLHRAIEAHLQAQAALGQISRITP